MSGRSFKDSIVAAFQPLARVLPGGMALGRALHRLVDPERRAIHRLRQRSDIALFQPFPTTLEERYGELFEALTVRLNARTKPHILSFGCSSGEEVRALRNHLPSAVVTGIDINPHSLQRARRADPDHAADYILSDRPPSGVRYDAILAMAVFRHGELEEHRPESCAALLPFDKIVQGIARLDAALSPGGWLAIGNAHYRFGDMPFASRYEAEPLRLTGHPPQALLYGPDNKRLDVEPYEPVLFRKLG